MRTAFVTALEEIAARNRHVWLLCGDLGFSVFERFAARFPDRYLNVGVAEQNMAGIAAGIAMSGETVFAYSIGNFATLRCLEQIRNDVCHHQADVKIVSVGGGYAYGSQGYTHHAIEDVGIMSTLPHLGVYVPADPAEVRAAVEAMAQSGAPAYLRLSRAGEPILDAKPIADVHRLRVLREGADVAMLASGPVAKACLQAAERLALRGIDALVASVPCLRPLDEAGAAAIVARVRLIAAVEEHTGHGGLHSQIAALLAGRASHPPLLGFSIPDLAPGTASMGGSRDFLMQRAGLSPEAIADRISRALRP